MLNTKIKIIGQGRFEIDKDKPVKRNNVSKEDTFFFPLRLNLVKIVDDIDCLFECKEWDMYELKWKSIKYGKSYFERTMKYAYLIENQQEIILKEGK